MHALVDDNFKFFLSGKTLVNSYLFVGFAWSVNIAKPFRVAYVSKPQFVLFAIKPYMHQSLLFCSCFLAIAEFIAC